MAAACSGVAMASGTMEGKWFAVQVRSRAEKWVAAVLRYKGYEEFSPTCQVKRCYGRVSRQLELPLFPGYIFCKLNSQVSSPILGTPGVIRVVGSGKTWIAVDEAELFAVMTAVKSGSPLHSLSGLRIGTKVRIQDGPLRNIEGVLHMIKKERYLVIALSLLNRSVFVTLDSHSATAIQC
ncbi:MAG: hypothetical protein LAO78_11665 [Acidobacteriia bacterium]|nr:hypothetical protein [Terriglobia bacterium]